MLVWLMSSKVYCQFTQHEKHTGDRSRNTFLKNYNFYYPPNMAGLRVKTIHFNFAVT
jgi:hypothetical protein